MNKTKTTAILTAALLATTIGATGAAGSSRPMTAGACKPSWQITPTPSTPGSIGSVTVSSTSNAWFTFKDPLHGPPYWTGHWDGHSLQTAPQPIQPPGPNISGEGSSFDSATDGWLLVEPLNAENFGVESFSLAEHWTGNHWQLTQTAVNPRYAATKHGLYPVAVTALSPKDAWAVGGVDDATAGRGLSEVGALIEHWDGTGWSVTANPVASKNETSLRAVTAVTARNVWAVGYQSVASGQVVPLAEHWDGTRWLQVTGAALPSTVSVAVLNTVSIHGGDVWAGGYQRINGIDQPLAEHYSNGTWTLVKGLPSLTATTIGGIYAAAADDVWATAVPDFIRGTPTDATGLGRPGEFLHWNGSTWSQVTPPGPQEYGLTYSYNSISGTGPDDIWAGGATFNLAEFGPGNPDPQSPLIAHLTCRR